MKRFIFAACCVIAVALIVPAQTRREASSNGSLASLIQKGDRKAALEKIRAGADVNEAQPDGTRPIHWAVFKVDYELLDALIAKKRAMRRPSASLALTGNVSYDRPPGCAT